MGDDLRPQPPPNPTECDQVWYEGHWRIWCEKDLAGPCDGCVYDLDWTPAYKRTWRCWLGRHTWRMKHDGRCVELCCRHCGRWKPWPRRG